MSRTVYGIDGRTVSRAEFERRKDAMKEAGGWFCAKTTTGGETGWELVDADGVKYQYIAVSEGDRNTQTLRRV